MNAPSSGSRIVWLRHAAHTRSGDKGDTCNVVVIAWSDALYPLLRDQLTAQTFAQHYDGVVRGAVTRYEVERLGVLNFVAEGALGGGVSRSLALDQYGKSLAAGLLNFPLSVPDALLRELKNYD